MSRRTELNDEVRDAIVESIRNGNWINVSARAAGIAKSTFYAWMDLGKPAEGPESPDEAARRAPFREFRLAVEEADAEAQARKVQALSKVADEGDTKALVEFLKRRWPREWGDRSQMEVVGAENGPKVLVIGPKPDQEAGE